MLVRTRRRVPLRSRKEKGEKAKTNPKRTFGPRRTQWSARNTATGEVSDKGGEWRRTVKTVDSDGGGW